MYRQTKLQQKSKSDANLNIGKHTPRIGTRCECCAMKPNDYLREQRLQRENKKLKKTTVNNTVNLSREKSENKKISLQPELKQMKSDNIWQKQKSPIKQMQTSKQLIDEQRRILQSKEENVSIYKKIQLNKVQICSPKQAAKSFQFKLIFEENTYKKQFDDSDQFSKIIKKLMNLLEQ